MGLFRSQHLPAPFGAGCGRDCRVPGTPCTSAAPRVGYAKCVGGAERRLIVAGSPRSRDYRRALLIRWFSYNSTSASQRLKINNNIVKINLMKPLAAGFFVILVSQNSQ
ncbi:MAG: hypothetical protein IKS45_11850 [Thermoguttaceae bacterium]|nr:hypothetical protein [Thermoguttaceae bacterium]